VLGFEHAKLSTLPQQTLGHRQLCKLRFIQKLVIHKQFAAVGLSAS